MDSFPSTRLLLPKPVIAIAGATGDLATRLINTLLQTELRSKIGSLILLSRRHTPRTKHWESRGAKVCIVDESSDERELVGALAGVDVLVNTISASGAKLRDNLCKALPQTDMKLYFPSEFGVDHTLHDFNILEWDGKKWHYDLTKKAVHGTNIQVCRLFVGMFLHSGIGPWYGFHTSKNVYHTVGSPDQSISYTDISDIARVICILAEQIMSGQKVPEELRIAATHSSVRQTARIMTEAGAGEIELKKVDLEAYRDRALGRDYLDRGPIVCLRFLMGDGRVDYRPKANGGLGNDNEIVNPGQKYFVWKTIHDFAAETKGRPNADA